MHRLAIDGVVGDNNGGNAFDDGVVESRHVNGEEFMPTYNGVVFVHPLCCATISHKALCTCCHFVPNKWEIANSI